MLSVSVASALVTVAAIYTLIGFVVAVPFVFSGAGRIDVSAAQGSIGFRLAIVPGCVALWPLVLMLWHRGRGFSEHNAHRDSAKTSA